MRPSLRSHLLASVLLGALATTITLVVLALPDPAAVDAAVMARAGMTITETLAAVACAVCARSLAGRARHTWALFAGAQAIWAATDLAALVIAATGGDAETPDILAVPWLSYYLPIAAGVALLYGRLRPEHGWQGVMDAGLLAGAMSLFLWVVVLQPAAGHVDGGPVGLLVSLTFPALDLISTGALAWLALRQRHHTPGWLWWLLAAFATTFVSGVAYMLAYAGDVPVLLTVAGVGYVLAGWFWVAAAVERTAWRRPVWGAAPRTEPPAWSRAMPVGAALAAVALVARDDGVLGLLVLGLVGLVAVRTLVTLRVARELLMERENLLVMDTLTHAQNRRHLQYELPRLFARTMRSGDSLAAVAFDLDHFKAVNDTHGHPAGDALLAEVAQVVRERLRLGDTLFRLGGDEFLVLMPATDGEGALNVGVRIAEAVQACAETLLPGCGVTASVGVASIPDEALTPADLLQNADAALYRAKRRGKARVVLFALGDDADDPRGRETLVVGAAMPVLDPVHREVPYTGPDRRRR